MHALVDRIRRRAIFEADLLRLRRLRSAFASSPPEDGPIALIVSLTQFVYQVKVEGMLAKALERKGLVPVALVAPGTWLPRRYFESFGVTQHVQLPDFVNADRGEEVSRVGAELLAQVGSMEEVKGIVYRGVPIGRHLYSTISRALHQGRVELDDPGARELLARLLPGSVRSTLAGEALLDALGPELLLFNERNYTGEAPLSDLALERGTNVIQFVSAFQDDALVFKRYTAETRGLHPRSLSDRSWERVKAMRWTPVHDAELDEEFRRRYDNTYALTRRNQEWTRSYGRDEIIAKLGLDPARKTAVVFSHVLWDANMFYGRDLFSDQEGWFVETVRAACENDRVNWIVKLHPANVWKLRRDRVDAAPGEVEALQRSIGDLPEHVVLLPADTDINPRSIFDVADYGVTIRGSVGIELPCFGVPVLTAGTGYYAGRGFTIDSASAAAYLDRLRRIEEIPPLAPDDVLLARRHAYALLRLRGTRFTSFESVFRPLAEMGHPLDHDLVVRIRTRADLERAEDLRRFGDWAVDSRDLDYLDLPPDGGG